MESSEEVLGRNSCGSRIYKVDVCRMVPTVYLYVVIGLIQVLVTTALTNPQDVAALQSLQDVWENVPPTWTGSDPCGDRWEGISCNNSRVVSISLSSMGLSGRLSGDIQGLAELRILDLSYNANLSGSLPQSIGSLIKLTHLILVGCSFSGPIPTSIGSLRQLVTLSLNSNNFFGQIPASIGLLSNLYWLDLADNKLEGSIPVSTRDSPGLDMLLRTKHFHFGNNRLSGKIPDGLFTSDMTLIHLLLENNRLNGTIPKTLGLVQTLEVVRLDNNALVGPVPQNLNNLTHVSELYLSNNSLTGPLPNLTGMDYLNYVDLSNNSFTPSDAPPWFSTLQSLSTLIMENTQLRGKLPVDLFSLPTLQTLILSSNKINETLDIGSSYSPNLQLIDLRNNSIDALTERGRNNIEILLLANPFCYERGHEKYCMTPQPRNNTYTTPLSDCLPPQCSSDKTPSPTCKCAYPYTGNLYFRALSAADLFNERNHAILEQSLMATFKSHQLPVDSVSLSNPTTYLDGYPALHLQVFPTGQDHFNRTGVISIGFEFSNQTFQPPEMFQPFVFRADIYEYLDGERSTRSHKAISSGVIVGAAVAGSVLVILVLLAGVYAFRQRQKAQIASRRSDPFASWDPNKNSGGVPQLKGASSFSFEELKKYTNNFSGSNDIGAGGYGKVYRGTLPNGQLVAIKRARQGSTQGSLEFKTEIELLSRVHHKNVVSLVGFCFDQSEQLLVYEYVANGTLKDSLSGKSGIRLDWTRRLRIALGSAKGLQYLHDLANPPIIHRDIKSTNILLDERLIAKVADFGLSKPVSEPERGHVSTQVKGTMGYMDPEYYMTNQLTEKSDVYSFGVLLLELITARNPIEKGVYIVRQVKQTIDKSKELYNLHGILDPFLGLNIPSGTLEKFVDLALRCVAEEGIHRPTMGEVVKELESIMELAGLNPNVESASSSASYEGPGKGNRHPYSNESLFSNSGNFPQ